MADDDPTGYEHKAERAQAELLAAIQKNKRRELWERAFLAALTGLCSSEFSCKPTLLVPAGTRLVRGEVDGHPILEFAGEPPTPLAGGTAIARLAADVADAAVREWESRQ